MNGQVPLREAREEVATNIDALEARVVDVEKGVAVVRHDVASVRQEVQRLETLILAQLAELKVQVAKLLERQHADEVETAKRKCPHEQTCMTVDGRIASLSDRLSKAEERVDSIRLWRTGVAYVIAFVVGAWVFVKEFLK